MQYVYTSWGSINHKTVYRNIFAKNRKSHKFATTNSEFEKKRLFRKCFIVLCTCISIFRTIGFFRLVKTVHTNLFAKKYCKLQFEFRKIALFRHALPDSRHLVLISD